MTVVIFGVTETSKSQQNKHWIICEVSTINIWLKHHKPCVLISGGIKVTMQRDLKLHNWLLGIFRFLLALKVQWKYKNEGDILQSGELYSLIMRRYLVESCYLSHVQCPPKMHHYMNWRECTNVIQDATQQDANVTSPIQLSCFCVYLRQ